jgi:thiol-disulfide isomerase/thioredoxin
MNTSFVLSCALLASVLADDTPPAPSSDATRLAALVAEFQADLEAWETRYDASTLGEPGTIDWDTHAGWSIARYKEYPVFVFAPRFLALARDGNAKGPRIAAAGWIVDKLYRMGPWSRNFHPVVSEAFDLLASIDPGDRAIVPAIEAAGEYATAAGERFLRAVLSQSPSPAIRGRACLALAQLVSHRMNMIETLALDRPTGKQSKFQVFLTSQRDPELVASLRSGSPAALLEESRSLIERTIKEFGHFPAARALRQLRWPIETLADRAREIQTDLALRVGQPAPEIEGTDASGKRFRLSDYRGQVVVLTFSGNWCGPCREMYPAERKLVDMYRDQPFAMLSVNTDPELDMLKKSIKAEEITWRCWWDGGTDGPITKAWAIRSFPTVFVLDQLGVIRFRDLTEDELEAAVATLVAEPAR